MRSDDGLSQPPILPTSLPVSPVRISYPVTIWVVLFIAFIYGFFPVVMMQFLMAAGLGPRLTGAPNPEQLTQLTRLNLIAGALAFPFQIASVVFLLPRFSGVRLEQIGLTS